jgi:hypothetical protein
VKETNRRTTVLSVLVVATLVLSAGCIGLSERSLPDGLAGYAGDPDNPYGDRNITVAVTAADSGRSFAPLVADAADYWETRGERYLNYSVNVTFVANESDPDLRVSFVPRIARCGEVESAAGCAPEITSPSQTGETVEVRALDNLSANSTVRVLEHEFGHALGLGHGDPPRELMATHTTLTSLPKPNASERALAWNDSTLSVFVTDDVSAAEREGIDHALDYYDRGAEGHVPKNVSFRVVSGFENADIVIRPTERSPCGPGAGSCGSVFGSDSDGDGALETYTRLEIVYSGLDADAVGWHVARWLALGFGIENESAYPPVLRETTGHDERRGDWWR